MDTAEKVSVGTKRCFHCGEYGEVFMTLSQYQEGVEKRNNGTLIQDAFPFLSLDESEQMISGTHPKCWLDMFGDDEEETE